MTEPFPCVADAAGCSSIYAPASCSSVHVPQSSGSTAPSARRTLPSHDGTCTNTTEHGTSGSAVRTLRFFTLSKPNCYISFLQGLPYMGMLNRQVLPPQQQAAVNLTHCHRVVCNEGLSLFDSDKTPLCSCLH